MRTTIKKGFTLVEILLYFAILGSVLLTVITFSMRLMDLSQKSDNFHELQSNVGLISQKIINSIQSADSINTADSIFNNDTGKLSLDMSDAAYSPTEFYLQAGAVYISEGIYPDEKISSDLVNCTILRFQKVSYQKSPDQIVVDMDCDSVYSNYTNLDQNLSFHTSVSLRK